MATYGFVVPISAGMEEADRQFSAELTGERRVDFTASRIRHGITRESVWIQQTPKGAMAVVLLEGEDIAMSLQGLATSTDPFDAWWRSRIQEIHGIDLSLGMPGPPNEQILDFRP